MTDLWNDWVLHVWAMRDRLADKVPDMQNSIPSGCAAIVIALFIAPNLHGILDAVDR